MPLQAPQNAAGAVPLAGPQVAAEAVSETMRLWDARMALLKRQPLVALAFHAIAMQEGRCDGYTMALVATLAHEAKQALQRENIDLGLIDNIYPPAPKSPGLVLAEARARELREAAPCVRLRRNSARSFCSARCCSCGQSCSG